MKKLTATLLALVLALSLAPAALAAPTAAQAYSTLEAYLNTSRPRTLLSTEGVTLPLETELYVDFNQDGVPELLRVFKAPEPSSPSVYIHAFSIVYAKESGGGLTTASAERFFKGIDMGDSFEDYYGGSGGNRVAFGRFRNGTYGFEDEGFGTLHEDDVTYYAYSNGKFTNTGKNGFQRVEFPTDNRFALYTSPKPAAVLSPQKLTVNGKSISCEKYNIDNANYFRLRDLAMLLSGTANQFDVGWDAATGTVTITTGKPYTPAGGELVPAGDKSSTASVSTQKVSIDGKAVTGLSVYNINNTNYFKLRDLGDKLGFPVDFDASSNTAIVKSSDYTAPDAPAASAADRLVYEKSGENAWYFTERADGYDYIGVFKFSPGGGLVFYAGFVDSEIVYDGTGSYQITSDGKLSVSAREDGGSAVSATYTVEESGDTLKLTQTSADGLFYYHDAGHVLTLNKGTNQ